MTELLLLHFAMPPTKQELVRRAKLRLDHQQQKLAYVFTHNPCSSMYRSLVLLHNRKTDRQVNG
jgi:hypothetical protein